MKITTTQESTIELNGKEYIIPKGTNLEIQKNKNIYKIDENINIILNGKKILIESGDFIEINPNGLKSNQQFKITSNGKQYLIESNDKIIIHEGWIDSLSKNQMTRAVMKEQQNIQNVIEKIHTIYQNFLKILEDRGIQSEDNQLMKQFTEILNSTQWEQLKMISNIERTDDEMLIANQLADRKFDIRNTMLSITKAFNTMGSVGKQIGKFIKKHTPRRSIFNLISQMETDRATKLTQKAIPIIQTEDGQLYIYKKTKDQIVAININDNSVNQIKEKDGNHFINKSKIVRKEKIPYEKYQKLRGQKSKEIDFDNIVTSETPEKVEKKAEKEAEEEAAAVTV